MLLVFDSVRLVIVRSSSEVDNHVQLGVERYARAKSRPCVLCICTTMTSRSVILLPPTKLPQLNPHRQLRRQDTNCINYQRLALFFCPSFGNFHFINQILFLCIYRAQSFLLRYSPWFHILCLFNLMQSDACFIHPTFISLRAMTRLRVQTLKPRLDVSPSNISSSSSSHSRPSCTYI